MVSQTLNDHHIAFKYPLHEHIIYLYIISIPLSLIPPQPINNTYIQSILNLCKINSHETLKYNFWGLDMVRSILLQHKSNIIQSKSDIIQSIIHIYIHILINQPIYIQHNIKHNNNYITINNQPLINKYHNYYLYINNKHNIIYNNSFHFIYNNQPIIYKLIPIHNELITYIIKYNNNIINYYHNNIKHYININNSFYIQSNIIKTLFINHSIKNKYNTNINMIIISINNKIPFNQ